MTNWQWQRLKRVYKIQSGVMGRRVAGILPEREKTASYLGYEVKYPSRSLIGRAIARGKLWDEALIVLVADLPTNSLVVDVGCNIGASMFSMLSRRPDLKVIAYEPSPRYFPILKANVEQNNLGDQVELRPVLVGPTGTQLLYTNDSTGSAVSPGYFGHSGISATEVPSVTLDDDIDPATPVALIKIDTDGFEAEVLKGAGRILDQQRPILFLEFTPSLLERAGSSAADLLGLLTSRGYQTADVFAPSGELLAKDHPLKDGIPVGSAGWVDLVLRPTP